MNVGMLWFDNDPKSDLQAKLDRAAAYYAKKYSQEPNICFVHPTMIQSYTKDTEIPEKLHIDLPNPLSNHNNQARSIELRSSRTILPNHLWIGVKSYD